MDTPTTTPNALHTLPLPADAEPDSELAAELERIILNDPEREGRRTEVSDEADDEADPARPGFVGQDSFPWDDDGDDEDAGDTSNGILTEAERAALIAEMREQNPALGDEVASILDAHFAKHYDPVTGERKKLPPGRPRTAMTKPRKDATRHLKRVGEEYLEAKRFRFVDRDRYIAAQRNVHGAMLAARDVGVPWVVIGQQLDMTTSAAHALLDRLNRYFPQR